MNKNEITLTLSSLPQNESLARTIISAFCLEANPTLEEISDVKTAVSEAVTNSIVHGYPNKQGKIKLYASLKDNKLEVEISDTGVGISDIKKAREPFYTTRPNEDRSGMGFTVMESFMDKVEVAHNKPSGVVVRLFKTFLGVEENYQPKARKEKVGG